MKKAFFPFLSLIGIISLAGCGGGTQSASSSSVNESSSSEDSLEGFNEFELDYEAYKEEYGDFTLTQGESQISPVDGVYYINVASSKLTYTLKGYLEGRIVIQNEDNLSTFKGVTLLLSDCFLKYDDSPVIEYAVDEKNIEIISAQNSTNYIVNTSKDNDEGDAIYSQNNVELDLKSGSSLNLYTVHGHTLKADGDVKLIGSGSLYLSSGHDGFHCHSFYTANSGTFSGNFTINNTLSQGIEASTSSGNGEVLMSGGTFVINNCESVLKVDKTISITGGSLTGEGIWSDPFVRGSKETLTLTINEGVSVVIDGETFSSQEI
ncbi:MAG: carbohydrate-binding domain-containing protein [Bacilli bacterium]|nr:carbohydrate-binding domain-containing protein [Bacilli bacterium]